jgi:predicted acetyltransferase
VLFRSSKENEVILIDEYTSVVDRDVAKSMSYALQKYIRRTNKKIVLASCHFDIMEWLLPDWTYSPLKGRVERHDYRRQSRPQIELSIFRCRYETWNIFKQHHYLSEELNAAAKCFCFTWNDKPVGFIAILPLPSGTIKDAFRVSRLVILPDYQGLSIGIKILNIFGAMYKSIGKSFFIKTSNPALFYGMENNKLNWNLVKQQNNLELVKNYNKKLKKDNCNDFKLFKESLTKSYKYIGEESKLNLSILTFSADVFKDIAQNQISLF